MKLYIICILLTSFSQPGEFSLKSSEVLNHLSTRTPYRFKYNRNDTLIKYPGCKPKKIWMIARHGTRYPSPEDVEGMNTILKDMKYEILMRHNLGKGNLTNNDILNLKEWKSKALSTNEKLLALEGREEMVMLAERMKKRFPGILKTKYDINRFLFRFTATERTQQSAIYFANGLFDKKEAKQVVFAPASKIDPVLRFYKHCDKWQKQVNKNPNTYVESKAFGTSQEMNETLKAVSKRLGLNHVLSLGQMILMYKACGFETAWNKYFPSPWCAVFDKENVEVLEYYCDLIYYWRDGYGLELTYRPACLSLKTMFDSFSTGSDPKAVFLFTHSGTLLKIIAHLGLYKPDAHLKADVLQRDRPWRATNIDCFAANLAFVLFSCDTGDHVLALHQERIIKLPYCEKELCPLKHLKEYFHDSIHNCDVNNLCSLERYEDL